MIIHIRKTFDSLLPEFDMPNQRHLTKRQWLLGDECAFASYAWICVSLDTIGLKLQE